MFSCASKGVKQNKDSVSTNTRCSKLIQSTSNNTSFGKEERVKCLIEKITRQKSTEKSNRTKIIHIAENMLIRPQRVTLSV